MVYGQVVAGSYTVISHTADIGIAVDADTLPEMLAWACRGMFELMYDLDALTPDVEFEIVVEAAGIEELLVDVLSEVLYRSEAGDLVPCTFTVGEASAMRARLTVGAVRMRPGLLCGAPIKAVTYHDLEVGQRSSGAWAARVIFDV